MEASSHRRLMVWVFGATLAVLVLMAAAATAWGVGVWQTWPSLLPLFGC
jgi:hypothetical protein